MGSTPSDEERMIKEPLLISQSPKGGLRTMPFIIANEAFERLASIGLLPNMILYLCREYNMEIIAATNVVFIWSAASNFLPILGAFAADSYVGRYPIIGFGCLTSLLGMVFLWLTTIFPQLRPPVCDQLSNNCESSTASQLLFLYSAFAFMSIGAGGIRASSLAFGADQLDKGDKIKNAGILQSYFSWYYVSVSASSMFAVTCIVYIQDNFGWKVGFGVPAVLMLLSALSFFLASPFYVEFKANTSLLTGLTQVLVASYKNRHINLSSQATGQIYHHKNGSTLVMPTENLRCLNKACIIRHPEHELTEDGRASNPWSLCTVDQVEDLKAVIKVIPLWTTGVMMAVTVSQNSLPVLQASSMDRHITPNFEIPSASFTIFMIITLVIWVGLCDRIIISIASKIKGKPFHLSLKQRMGIGLLFSIASMAAWAIVENVRRELAIKEGISDDPQAVVQMSAMWLIPLEVLSGLATAFNTIGQNEFYYSELPKSMSSIASTLLLAGTSVGNLVASFILNALDDITKRGGKESWVPDNINKGHYDYYIWLLAGLSVANFMYFLACSKAYGPCKGQISENDSTREHC
ncbi:Protein NRT1/ PTR FAMILY 1.2 like [Melia azedarach]|uniref:Protein NRT1/ PTR FAMILY 1.2 like n=1 Tax=Melia azedarach TaxID=155640 RepID=A0ACC1XA86_MELAZ|nr:Protein NRT1/ PTR FAMILY 1.2 like [Melia azedarach]